MTATVPRPGSVAELVEVLASYTDEHFAVMTADELDRYELDVQAAQAALAREDESDWRSWLRAMFRSHFRAPFAAHHEALWEWVWRIRLGERPEHAFVAVWPRGGAKSTSAEAAVAALGARGTRRFCLYVCATQQQADDHVQNIASLLESRHLGRAYPELGRRAVSKYGTAKGWRRNRLRTASGLIVDALGLDTAARGIKVDEFRPDLMVFDDIDDERDGPGQVDAKITSITQKLLPAGDGTHAVLVIQNLPNPDGVVARLAGVAKEPADFLRPRIVSGPVPALEEFTYEPRDDGGTQIVHGVPTWEGQSVARCQQQVDEWGITSFRTEAQHETGVLEGGMYAHITFRHCKPEEVPWSSLTQIAVWCDPAVTNTDNSDSQAVQVDGLADGVVYRLRSWEERSSPLTAIKVAVAYALRYGTRKVGIETDQGGDTWISVYKEAVEAVRADLALIAAGEPVDGPDEYVAALVVIDAEELVFPLLYEPAQEKAGSSQLSKAGRQQQQLGAYETHSIVHMLGTHLALENALRRFGRRKPFDLADASYWSLRELLRFGKPASTSARKSAARQFANPRGGTMARRTVVR